MHSHPRFRRFAAWPPVLFLALAMVQSAALAREVPARLDWAQRLELGTPVSGLVTRVHGEPGQRVQRGEVLVQMDDRGIRAELSEAQAQVRRLEIVRAEAELEHERAKELYDRTVISQRDLSLAEIAFAMADADLVAARARLTRTRLDLEYSQVRAPFDALILARHVQQGQAVSNELQIVPLLTLAAADTLVAKGEVTEDELATIREGQAVQIQVGEHRYDGTLRSLGLDPVSAVSDAAHYMVTVHFSAPAAHRLRAGQRATLILATTP